MPLILDCVVLICVDSCQSASLENGMSVHHATCARGPAGVVGTQSSVGSVCMLVLPTTVAGRGVAEGALLLRWRGQNGHFWPLLRPQAGVSNGLKSGKWGISRDLTRFCTAMLCPVIYVASIHQTSVPAYDRALYLARMVRNGPPRTGSGRLWVSLSFRAHFLAHNAVPAHCTPSTGIICRDQWMRLIESPAGGAQYCFPGLWVGFSPCLMTARGDPADTDSAHARFTISIYFQNFIKY